MISHFLGGTVQIQIFPVDNVGNRQPLLYTLATAADNSGEIASFVWRNPWEIIQLSGGEFAVPVSFAD